MRRLLAVLALVTSGLAMAPGTITAAGAQEEVTFSGYQGRALAQAVSFQPLLPSVLPVDAPFELTYALTNATLTSGGNAFARAAPFWPGSVIAGLGALVGFVEPSLAGIIPPWPLAVETRAADGDKSGPAYPGVTMEVRASAVRADGLVKAPDLVIPDVLTVDSVMSRSTSAIADEVLTSTARVVLEGLSLRGGLVSIEGIRTRTTASSDATTGKTDEEIDVVGLVVNGMAATIDERGVRAADQGPIPGQDPTTAIRDALSNAGITIRLLNGVETVSGSSADRFGGALVVTIATPAVATVPPGHLLLVLGSTEVGAKANPEVRFDLPDLGGGGLGAVAGGDLGAVGGAGFGGGGLADVGLGLGTTPSGTAGATEDAGATATFDTAGSESDAYDFAGIPLSLIAAFLVGVWFLALRIRRYVVAVVSLKE